MQWWWQKQRGAGWPSPRPHLAYQRCSEGLLPCKASFYASDIIGVRNAHIQHPLLRCTRWFGLLGHFFNVEKKVIGEEGWVFESDRFFEWNKWSTRHVVLLGLSNASHTFGLSHTGSTQQEIRSISNRKSFHAITLCNHAHSISKSSVVSSVRLEMKGILGKKFHAGDSGMPVCYERTP